MSDQTTVDAGVDMRIDTTVPVSQSTEISVLPPSQKLSVEHSKADINDWRTLVQVTFEALKTQPRLIKSILGPASTWLPPYRDLSEFTISDPWHPVRAINYLVDINIPARPCESNKWARTFLPPVVNRLFWRPSYYYQQPDPFDRVTSFPKEQWFYINGICTNRDVAEFNSQLLTDMFYRPVTVIQNMTDSIVVDLWECAIGKAFKILPNLNDKQTMTEPALKTAVALLEAMTNPNLDRVVLVCHSQGTIITANVLRALENAVSTMLGANTLSEASVSDTRTQNMPESQELLNKLVLACLTPEDVANCSKEVIRDHITQTLSKLEVYTFANCADRMIYVASIKNEQGDVVKQFPYIENFANENDLVAKLGILSPLNNNGDNLVHIDGALFKKTGKCSWGHLLNQHYLFDIQAYLVKGMMGTDPYPRQKSTNGPVGEKSRLYGYFEGQGRLDD